MVAVSRPIIHLYVRMCLDGHPVSFRGHGARQDVERPCDMFVDLASHVHYALHGLLAIYGPPSHVGMQMALIGRAKA
ncbi:hypothetical protein D3C84_1225850 [compost metagenome]